MNDEIEIYILNLPSKTERKNHMVKLMTDIGFDKYQLIEPVSVVEAGIGQLVAAQRSLNETYIQLLESLYEKQTTPYVLIFEDDVVPTIHPKKVIPMIKLLLSNVPNDWDILYLEYCSEFCMLQSKVSPEISKAVIPLCSAAIIYNVSKIYKCLSFLKNFRFQFPIDQIYKKYIFTGDLVAYTSTPAMFIQDTRFETTIMNYTNRLIFGYHSCNTFSFVAHTIIISLFIIIIVLWIRKLFFVS